jgi:hypothetical protein
MHKQMKMAALGGLSFLWVLRGLESLNVLGSERVVSCTSKEGP